MRLELGQTMQVEVESGLGEGLNQGESRVPDFGLLQNAYLISFAPWNLVARR